MAGWPLIDRAELVTSIRSPLRAAGRVTLITGASGMGKTTLTKLAARASASDGLRPIVVIGIDELSSIPLGALSSLLADTRLRDTADTGERLIRLVELIGDEAASVILVVDDAPALDDASAAALYSLIRLHGVRAVLTGRDGERLPRALARLHHDDLISTVAVPPFTPDEMERAVEQCLGGAVSPGSLQRLQTDSHGNPLLLRELVASARDRGAVSATAHGLVVDPGPLPAHLEDALLRRVEGLSAASITLLELLSLAQPVSDQAITQRTDLDSLAEQGLATLGDEGWRILQPLVGQLALGRLTAQQRAERAAQAAELLDSIGEQPPARMRRLRLLHASGAAVPTEDLIWAASFALSVHDHELARSLSEEALRSSPDSAAAATVNGTALSALDQPEGAEQAFAHALAVADDDRERGLALVRLGQHLALRRGDAARAERELAAHAATLAGEARTLVEAERVKWRSMSGGLLSAPPPMPGSDQELTGAALLGELIMRAMIGTMSTQLDPARSAVAEARPLAEAHRPEIPYASSLIGLNEFLIDIFDGRIEDGRRRIAQHLDGDGPDAQGLWNYTAALLDLHTGRTLDAVTHAARAVRGLRWRDFTGLVAPADAVFATALAKTGETTAAEARIAAIDPAHFADAKVVLQVAEARAWSRHAAGQRADATAILVEAASAGLSSGHVGLSALTASAAVLQGDPAPVVDLLEAAAAFGTSALVAALRDHGRSLARGDAEGLIAAAETQEAMGFALGAQRAWEQAADLVEAARQGEHARTLRRRAQRLAAAMGIERTPGDRAASILTNRERSVASLAARRMRSREIAEKLGLSVRTVDNHLASIFRKLEIGSRDELARALAE